MNGQFKNRFFNPPISFEICLSLNFDMTFSLYYIKYVIFQDQTTALEDKRWQLNQAFEKEVIHIMALDTAVAECMWGPINMVIS